VRMSQDGDEKPSVDGQLATDEPLADWERELLAGDASAATPAPSAGQVVEGAGTEASAPTSEAAPASEAAPTSEAAADPTAEPVAGANPPAEPEQA
jgi:small subunit ribosomal protein S2